MYFATYVSHKIYMYFMCVILRKNMYVTHMWIVTIGKSRNFKSGVALWAIVYKKCGPKQVFNIWGHFSLASDLWPLTFGRWHGEVLDDPLRDPGLRGRWGTHHVANFWLAAGENCRAVIGSQGSHGDHQGRGFVEQGLNIHHVQIRDDFTVND
mgnify:CR=1 FL=1